MNGHQMLLVIGAIVIFSLLNLSAHRSILNSTEMTLNSEYIITATAIAEELMTEINSKAYDENTISNFVKEVSDFSDLSFGPESGESYTVFDDIDDYHNYSTTVATPRTGQFTADVTIEYVSESNPDYATTYKTRTKRITVQVTGEMLTRPIHLYHFCSY